ncbi:hypothetical protein BGZ70_002570 [Mortierella alpina]|uniref:Extracellular membrane protein CFEM domain-containing protein n=1 Tax=Mortierella alpina TaxID=64518 RepID=A0A9P6LWQ2_MORAP|nr:hypothetical protein BGZ70_002570 [Mortierella alpina]
MKFLLSLALLATATVVSAQNGAASCTICLQNAIMALPKCAGLNITMTDFDPSLNPAYSVCLCSSLDGAWVDGCSGADKCGQDILSFKKAFADNIKSAGLSCEGTPSFVKRPV